MGDIEKGKKLFQKLCTQCHTADKNGKHKLGPNLFNIFGTTCGSKSDYTYTQSMKTKNVDWTDESLDEYLKMPKKFVPGTKMIFAGMKKEEDRKDMISYLKSLK